MWPGTRSKPKKKKEKLDQVHDLIIMQFLGVAGVAVLLVAVAAGETKGSVGSAPKHTVLLFDSWPNSGKPSHARSMADQEQRWTGWVKLPLPYPAVKQYAQDVPSSVYPWRPSAIDQVRGTKGARQGVELCAHPSHQQQQVGVIWTFLTAYGTLCCAAGSVQDQAQAAADQAVPGPDPRLRCVGPSGQRSSAVQSPLLLLQPRSHQG